MEAPKCRLCKKRHYGLCIDPITPDEPRARKKASKPARREKKSNRPDVEAAIRELPISEQTQDGLIAAVEAVDEIKSMPAETSKAGFTRHRASSEVHVDVIGELLSRVEHLEARLNAMETRKKYMRDYQRARRAREKGE